MACSTDTLSDYTTTVNTNGGCTENGLLFSNFNYISTSTGTAIALPASAVAISPLLNSMGDGFGFQILGGWGATANGESDGILQYEVSTVSGAASLTGISTSFNGTYVGTGIANVSENYCAGGTSVPPSASCTSGLKNIMVESSASGTSLMASAGFAGVNSITVSKDIQVNGGTAGTATISMVTNQFDTGTMSGIPEPGSFMLLGMGLLGLGVARKRFVK